jgi:hypothetical protein
MKYFMFLTVVDRVIQFCLTKGRYAFTNQTEDQVPAQESLNDHADDKLE